jgi:hypothetical protein
VTEKPEPDRFAQLPERVKPEDMTTSQAEPPPPASALDANDEEWSHLRNAAG